MLKNLVPFLLAAPLLLASSPALSQSESFGETHGWSIYQAESSCYMLTYYEEDTTFSIYVSDGQSAEFWVQDKAWQSLSNGSVHNIDVEFDSHGAWGINATGKSDADGPGLAWLGNIAENSEGDTFFGEFMASSAMTIRFNGRTISNLDITGSREAALILVRCLKDMSENKDPFRNSQRQTDPFAQ